MNIKRYVAGTVQEALQMVKREMGPEAVILETKTIQGSRGAVEGKKIEVTAAVDYAVQAEPSSEKIALGLRDVIERYRHLEAELREMKEIILSAEAGKWLERDIRNDRVLRARYMNLRRFGLRPEVVSRLLEGEEEGMEKGADTPVGILQDSLSRVLDRVSIARNRDEEKGRRIVAFIGPTGVGKTTTLAKLAALGAIRQGRKAALITTDTFRVAAASQLEVYARIMSIPMETATDRASLLKAVEKHKDKDFILIDTAGSSPNREELLQEQGKMLEIPAPVQSNLVLSATTRYQDLLHIDRQFGTLPFRSYIFTKLDEAEDGSSMINFLISRDKPVSYFSTGQQVPDDIEKATKKKVASLLLARLRRGAGKQDNEVSVYGSGESTEGRGSGTQCDGHGKPGAAE
jgi:flagellar biosynthesis protein FlhF